MIKIILIAVTLGIVVMLLRHRAAMRARAWKRLLLLGLVGAAIVTILRPEASTRVANFVGVGRGTDLLLYLLTVLFLYVTVTIYLKFRDVETRITALARRLAIEEALADEPRDVVAEPVTPHRPSA